MSKIRGGLDARLVVTMSIHVGCLFGASPHNRSERQDKQRKNDEFVLKESEMNYSQTRWVFNVQNDEFEEQFYVRLLA